MRTIKFRAWDEKLKKMFVPKQLDAYGTIVVNVRHEDSGGLGTHPEEYPNPYKLMQFTGLLDRNGKEIYENDLVRGEAEDVKTIGFSQGTFTWDDISLSEWEIDTWEVVGNEFEGLQNKRRSKEACRGD